MALGPAQPWPCTSTCLQQLRQVRLLAVGRVQTTPNRLDSLRQRSLQFAAQTLGACSCTPAVVVCWLWLMCSRCVCPLHSGCSLTVESALAHALSSIHPSPILNFRPQPLTLLEKLVWRCQPQCATTAAAAASWAWQQWWWQGSKWVGQQHTQLHVWGECDAVPVLTFDPACV